MKRCMGSLSYTYMDLCVTFCRMSTKRILIYLVPDNAPDNVRVTGSSPSSVFVYWIPPSSPNGLIASYNLYINYTDGSPIAVRQSTTANCTVSGLQPYQLVAVRVSASTSAGEGPMSEVVSGRTIELGKFSIIGQSNITKVQLILQVFSHQLSVLLKMVLLFLDRHLLCCAESSCLMVLRHNHR